jgi:hypothetical protein
MTRHHYFASKFENFLVQFNFHADITDRKSTSCISFPLRTGLRVAFPCFILREQFGNRYAITVWSFWYIIDVMDGFFPFSPTCSSIALKKSRVRVMKDLAVILSKMAFAMSTINLLIYWVGLHPAPGNIVHFICRCVEIKKKLHHLYWWFQTFSATRTLIISSGFR